MINEHSQFLKLEDMIPAGQETEPHSFNISSSSSVGSERLR
jgi:hypothetical protein